MQNKIFDDNNICENQITTVKEHEEIIEDAQFDHQRSTYQFKL